jgi:hypothetical protein
MKFISFMIALFATLACGADDTKEEVKNTVNCAEICQKYSDCVTDIDVSSCTDQCEDRADVDEAYATQAGTCENCLDGRACGEAQSQGCWQGCPPVPTQ